MKTEQKTEKKKQQQQSWKKKEQKVSDSVWGNCRAWLFQGFLTKATGNVG